MKGMTERQADILQALITMSRDRGFPPTVRELADRFAVTHKTIYDQLQALQKKGFISIEPKVSRGIKILGRSEV